MQIQLNKLIFYFFWMISITSFAKDLDDPIVLKSEKEYLEKEEGASAKGNIVIQPTFTFGHHIGFSKLLYDGNYYGAGLVPGVAINLDYNVHDYISIGLQYAVAFKNYKDLNTNYLANAVGARVGLHWWQLLDDKLDVDLYSDKLDLDIHAHIGAYLVRFKNNTSQQKTKNIGLNAGGGIAFRYFFNEHFGVAIEAGYEEVSFAKIGFAIKF